MCIHCNKHASLSPQPDSLPPPPQKPPAVDNSQELHHQQKRRKLVYPPPVAYQLRVPTSFDSPKSPETILGKENYEDIRDHYTLGKELGRGRFGITYLCIENSTGKAYACKSIPKKRLSNRRDRDDVRREIEIMEHLKGQPNVVQFQGAYEDKDSVHLVMELCAGGELFDRLTVKGQYSEKAAAAIIRSILNAVHFCHLKGVMHRDLKPENFLLSTNGEGAILKATDFGLSVFIEEGKVYRDVVGSAYYIAPEVLQRNYGKEIDIWSAGVILYVLLSGIPPFYAEDDKGIFDAIVKGEVNFDRKPWPSISESAKDLIGKMLTMDPKKRITSSEALEHQWLREIGEDRPIDGSVIARMNCFVIFSKLRKLGSKIKTKLRCYTPPAKEKLP